MPYLYYYTSYDTLVVYRAILTSGAMRSRPTHY